MVITIATFLAIIEHNPLNDWHQLMSAIMIITITTTVTSPPTIVFTIAATMITTTTHLHLSLAQSGLHSFQGTSLAKELTR